MTYSPPSTHEQTLSIGMPHHPWAYGYQARIVFPTSSAVWTANNRAYYWPFVVPRVITVYKLFVCNAGTASGNLDIGIYDEGSTLLVSTGSTAQTGTNTIQLVDVTDTTLPIGRYYWALALSSTSGTVRTPGTTLVTGYTNMLGVRQEDSAFPLPATATMAASGAFHVHGGMQARTTDL